MTTTGTAGYWTAPDAAREWDTPPSTVRKWLLAGRIPGAVKLGRDWLIPAGTPRPPALPEGAAAHRKRRPQAGAD